MTRDEAEEMRLEFERRITMLQPDTRPRWGHLTAPLMICHLSDQLRLALGDLPARRRRSLVRYFPFRELAIYLLPWPKGRVEGPPETFSTPPRQWPEDISTLRTLLVRLVEHERKHWPDHPMFGPMSRQAWLVLTRRHFDHHLRQFGA
ncbi:MAG: DUF1569 domain-containing protein [Gemmatimonadales bacterium]